MVRVERSDRRLRHPKESCSDDCLLTLEEAKRQVQQTLVLSAKY